MIYGYSRVSTHSQDLEAQREALTAAGCDMIFAEKMSGKMSSNRPQLQALLMALKAGDTIMVTRLDRLARSTRDLLNLLAAVGEAGAFFKSIADVWADSSTMHGRLMLTILGGLAEFERALIIERTNEGKARARAAGKKFGPKFKLTPHQRAEVRARLMRNEAAVELARSYGVSQWTIRRLGADLLEAQT